MDRDHTKTDSLVRVLDLARKIQICQTQTTQLLGQWIKRRCESSRSLNPQDIILLSFCQQQQRQGVSQRQLARGTGSSPARISNRLESLRRQGLVTGFRTTSDRRRQTWRLTPAGSQLLEQLSQSTNSDDVIRAFDVALKMAGLTRAEAGESRRDAA